MARSRPTRPSSTKPSARGRNLVAKALAGAVFRQRVAPSGKLYRRVPKHRERRLREWFA